MAPVQKIYSSHVFQGVFPDSLYIFFMIGYVLYMPDRICEFYLIVFLEYKFRLVVRHPIRAG